jgi:Icc-related predicted phosphoesterase
MKIVCISDTHSKHEGLVLPAGDVLVHAGDWTGRGSEKSTIEFLKWLNYQPYKHKVFISGNHDFYGEQHSKAFRLLVALHAPNCIYLENSAVAINGVKFYGAPQTPRFFDWAFNVNRGPDIKKYWDAIDADTDVLITHGPSMGVMDLVVVGYSPNCGEHVGCQDLADRIEQLPKLQAHIFGHIHSGHGKKKIGKIIHVNAATCSEEYKPVNRPIVISVRSPK